MGWPGQDSKKLISRNYTITRQPPFRGFQRQTNLLNAQKFSVLGQELSLKIIFDIRMYGLYFSAILWQEDRR